MDGPGQTPISATGDPASVSGLTRRELLQRGAKVGGAVWVIPVVQVLGMSQALAGENGQGGTQGPSGLSEPSEPSDPSDPSDP